eukprot:3492669-Alexandrium_andersonii.AAC.1
MSRNCTKPTDLARNCPKLLGAASGTVETAQPGWTRSLSNPAAIGAAFGRPVLNQHASLRSGTPKSGI